LIDDGTGKQMRSGKTLIGVIGFPALVLVNAVWAATVNKSADLSFGGIAAGAGGGTVSQSTHGSRTTTGGVVAISAMPGSAASFAMPDSRTGCIFTLPANGSVFLNGPGTAMSVTNFHSTLPLSPSTFNTPQTAVFVGATLNVGANQTPGVYSGNYAVTLTCE
jgi:hypothetical protein